MHVLILDDDEDLAATLVDVLAIHGHTVDLASSITEARQKLQADTRFHVAVFDVNIDRENSISLVGEIKRAIPEIRIVSMTGGGDIQANVGIPLAAAHGADAVLFKPFDLDEFRLAIEGS